MLVVTRQVLFVRAFDTWTGSSSVPNILGFRFALAQVSRETVQRLKPNENITYHLLHEGLAYALGF